MKRLGSYREFYPGEPVLESLADYLDVLDDMTRRRLSYYLLGCSPMTAIMSGEPDPLDGEELTLSLSTRTDGDWYWREDLAHYVLKYGVALPPEFIAHVARQGWLPPVLRRDEVVAAFRSIRDLQDVAPSRTSLHDAVWRWDPLMIADALPETADEYDTFIDRLWSCVRRGASAAERLQVVDEFVRGVGFAGHGEAEFREWLVEA